MMPSAFVGTNQPERILRRFNLLTLFLLTYLIASNPNNLLPPRTRVAKGTRTAKGVVFGAVRDEDKTVAITFL